MQISSIHFKARAAQALNDDFLQGAMQKTRDKFTGARAAAVAAFPGFEELRERGAQARHRAIARLDKALLEFEGSATAAGAKVLFAKDARTARRLIVEIGERHQIRRAIKSKSMICEEIALGDALAAAGINAVETDLGEYILQLAGEPPSHIIAPAMHKRREDVAALFAAKHGGGGEEKQKKTPAELCREAREVLRPHLLSAQMSITGANFLVAESGAVVLVTNEGNGRFAAATPPVRVTVAGIDKVINTRRDLATLLKLLPRSATGQEISNYVSLSVGAGRNAENPQHHYIVLVDGGRSAILQSEFAEMLRCIRCGACMNHCPVYQLVGGHAYGWVYPGPMGAVLTPLLAGIKAAPDLPHAATMCGACEVVCPVKIPLPDLMRKLRERQATKKENIRPISERVAMRLWAFCARRPLLYSLIAMAAARMLKIIARRRGRISQLPFMQGWFANRDLPAPQGRTFRELQRAALEN